MKTLTPEEEAILEKTRQWVSALRSGYYKQTTNVLKRLDPISAKPSYCCLGVICELKIKNGEGGMWGDNKESENAGAKAFITDKEQAILLFPDNDFVFAISNEMFDTYNLVKAETTIPVEIIPKEANLIITPKGARQIINNDTTFIDVLIAINDAFKEPEGFGRIWMTIEAVYKHFGYEL